MFYVVFPGADGLVAEITEEFNRDRSTWRMKAMAHTTQHAHAKLRVVEPTACVVTGIVDSISESEPEELVAMDNVAASAVACVSHGHAEGLDDLDEENEDEEQEEEEEEEQLPWKKNRRS